MHNYFLVKTKFEKTSEEGKIEKVSRDDLVDALSFTEAEARIIEEMRPFISGEFTIKSLKRFNVSEIFFNENGDKWFKAKINFVVFDEEKGKWKKTSAYMLIQASDMASARINLIEGMKGTMDDWKEESITETKIMEVFKWKE
jgi:hypothetical protein